MHFLITGACGFIGTHLTNNLRKEGHRVSGFSKQGHLTIEDLVYEKPDVLIHLAAFVKNTNERKHLDDTVLTHRITDYVKAYSPKTRLVYASTVNVYKTPTPVGCDENTDMLPRSLYEYGKMVGEHIIKQHNNWAILRLSNVYGPGMRHGVIKDWLAKDAVTISEKEPFSTRCFVNIGAVVDAFKAVSLDTSVVNDTFNVCGPEYTNLQQLASYMQLPFFTTNSRESTILLPSGAKLKDRYGIEDKASVALEVHRMKFPGERP